jgi:ferrous iron transport protein A
MSMNLAELRAGQTAEILALSGGMGMRRKLEAMGVRPGKTVRKLSSQFMAGPVTILVDGRQVAMGRGIARRVEVREVGP